MKFSSFSWIPSLLVSVGGSDGGSDGYGGGTAVVAAIAVVLVPANDDPSRVVYNLTMN